MARTLSSVALASANAEATGEVWLELVTIYHDDLPSPIRVVNNIEDIESQNHTFEACAFDVEAPGEGPDGPGEARLTIDNVDRAIVLSARLIQAPPTVRYQIVLASQPDTIEMDVDYLVMRDVTWDAFKVSGTLRFEDILGEPIAETITPERFPALFGLLLALPIAGELLACVIA